MQVAGSALLPAGWSRRQVGDEPAEQGVVAMVVLEYQLECGCSRTVRVPVQEVVSEQITGVIPVRCLRCDTERPSRSVQMRLE